jgi:acyl transferase domain-containing protein/NADPH:quinone reductase-like Zn-dependent oxidoreductase/acyl carrier protein
VFTGAGISHAVLSGRVSHLLGVTGPSFTLDTACSSSLYATHLACESIQRGESKMAIAGGANIFLTPEGQIALSRSGMMSPDGKCKAFDAGANGFVRAEGAGVVVLRPLEDALAEGNPVYAVIRGTGVSSDGRGGGHMMAPSRDGQAQAMRDAYSRARIDPSKVQFVETHGTGTVIGDPVEIGALADVMGPGRAADEPLLVASVKGNLGHAESASGVAGLIKAALSIKHRSLPAQLHFEKPSPAIPWDEIPIRVQTETTPWPGAGPALAGVNSFGISGTNAHVILESAPCPAEMPSAQREASRAAVRGAPDRPCLLTISAHEPMALEQMVERHRDAARSGRMASLYDLGYTLGCRKAQRPMRLDVVAASPQELAEELDAYLDGTPSGAVHKGIASGGARPELVMVFPGQGAQWVGMGRELLAQEPVFRESIARIDAAYARHVDWSLQAVIEGRAGFDWRERLDVLQPLLVAVEVALAELWASWGIRPDRVIGQSMGEIAAARVAGCLTLEAMARLACQRGLVVAQASGMGAMGVVAMSVSDLEPELERFAGRVEVAGASAPQTTLVSGDRDVVHELIASLDCRGVFARPLEVEFASHCFHMDPLLDGFRERIEGLSSQPGGVSFISTVDSREKSGLELDADYWVRNLRAPVSFTEAVGVTLDGGSPIFLEVSPHSTLARPIQEIADARGGEAPACFGSLQRDQDEQRSMLNSLAGLHAIGFEVDFESLYPEGRLIETPLYAYQRKRYWFGERTRADSFRTRHPLLGPRRESSIDSRQSFWDIVLDLDAAPYLADFRIDGHAGVPVGLYLELALAVCEQRWPGEEAEPCEIEVRRPCPLPESKRMSMQLVLEEEEGSGGRFQVRARSEQAQGWSPLCRGRIRRPDRSSAAHAGDDFSRESAESLSASALLDRIEGEGLSLGRRMRAIKELECLPDPDLSEALAATSGMESEARTLLVRLMLPRVAESEWFAYHAHPALVEGALQVLGESFARGGALQCVSIGRVSIPSTLGSECWCRVTPKREPGTSTEAPSRFFEADLEFFDREGKALGWIEDLRAKPLGLATSQTDPRDADLHRVQWQRIDRSDSDPAPIVARWILVADSEIEAQSLAVELEKKGDRCDFCERLEDLAPLAERLRCESSAPWGLALLGWADRSSPDRLEPELHRSFRIASWSAAIREHCAEAAEVWIATRGLQRVEQNDPLPGASVAALLADVEAVASFSELEQCRVFDASAALHPAERVAMADLMGIATPERQLAARGPALFVARLASAGPAVSGSLSGGVSPFGLDAAGSCPAGSRAYRAELEEVAGVGQVLLREISPSTRSSRGWVEVEVRAASLSALDVYESLGLSRSPRERSLGLGRDFAGVVTACAEDVEGFVVGDRVMGLADGAVSRWLSVPASRLARLPRGVDFLEAAGLPLAYSVASFALEELAGLRSGACEGQRVLIRSAAGGVGLAAASLAQALGAEVYATAGTRERRARLCERGVCVLEDEPKGDFDVILGAEGGEALHQSLACLRRGGRYVDLNPHREFELEPVGAIRLDGNRRYCALDFGALVDAELASLLEKTTRAVGEGTWQKLPAHVFPVSEGARALRFLTQNRHFGRVTLDLSGAERVEIRPEAGTAPLFEADGVYLVAGTRPDLQAPIAEWLRARGAGDVRSIASRELDGVLVEAASGAIQLRGIVHVEPASGPLADVLPRWISRVPRDGLDLVALVSLRARGSDREGRAWETRCWIDRLLLAALDGTSIRSSGLSVSDEIAPARIVPLLERSIQEQATGSVWVSLDPEEVESRALASASPLFAELEVSVRTKAGASSLRQEVLSLAAGERRRSMDRFVGDSLATVLSLGERDRAALDLARPLDQLGLDSLMMMELFLGLSRELELEIAREWFPHNPSAADVSAVLVEQLTREGLPLAAGEG